MEQPLLVSRPSAREVRQGRDPNAFYCLVPEFCQLTGLSDEMRSNFGLMRDMGEHFFQPPATKLRNTVDFVRRLRNNEKVQEELAGWGVQIMQDPLQLKGRLLPREKVLFGPYSGSTALVPFEPDQRGEFTQAFRTQKMVKCVALKTWVIIVPERDVAGVENLVKIMQRVAHPLGFEISNEAQRISVRPHPRCIDYEKAISGAIDRFGLKVQMIFAILPNNHLDIYATVKKLSFNKLGTPSQCFLSKNMASKGLMSIATKLVVQMNAKLGGVPWQIIVPVKKLMAIGFDVYHGKKGSIGAMTCTTTDDFGTFYSCVSFAQGGSAQEISNKMASNVIKCCIAFQNKNNGALPARIVFYRDGVGFGQLTAVYETELTSINVALEELYRTREQESPKFTLIVVTKKINTRIFRAAGQGFENPPPGTIVDTDITLPERWDFFLVAQAARQGVVSPTSYTVLWDLNQLSADKLQRLTYKMCHLYYNWSGTVAVPAVCQFAHKLAYLTGMATERPAHVNLMSTLYFL